MGSYTVHVTFTSNDPEYTDASLSVPAAIVINPSQAFINGPNGIERDATS